MTMKKHDNILHLRHFVLLGRDCISINCEMNQLTRKALFNVKSIKYSPLNKFWYIVNEGNNLNELTKSFESILNIDYKPLSESEKKILFANSIETYNSIFISYSVKDRTFANKLNDRLNSYLIKTFLWEKDAPFGKPLKEIMSENINKYDRILFIASENSLRSPACQFELSNGRLKQEKLLIILFCFDV